MALTLSRELEECLLGTCDTKARKDDVWSSETATAKRLASVTNSSTSTVTCTPHQWSRRPLPKIRRFRLGDSGRRGSLHAHEGLAAALASTQRARG